MSFLRDRAIGSQGESVLIGILNKHGLKTEINSDPKKNKDYDVKAYGFEQEFTFEVKYDVYAARSGNIAIEFFNPKQGKASGVEATKADFWAHILTDPFSVWLSPVESLRTFIKNTKPLRIVSCGGDNNASLYLYRKDIILDGTFSRVDECNLEEFRGILLRQPMF
jgi:hypothetical protein